MDFIYIFTQTLFDHLCPNLTKANEGKKSSGHGFHHCHSENNKGGVVCERKSENLQGMRAWPVRKANWPFIKSPSIHSAHFSPTGLTLPVAHHRRGPMPFGLLTCSTQRPSPHSVFITAQFLATNKILTVRMNWSRRGNCAQFLVVKSTKI